MPRTKKETLIEEEKNEEIKSGKSSKKSTSAKKTVSKKNVSAKKTASTKAVVAKKKATSTSAIEKATAKKTSETSTTKKTSEKKSVSAKKSTTSKTVKSTAKETADIKKDNTTNLATTKKAQKVSTKTTTKKKSTATKEVGPKKAVPKKVTSSKIKTTKKATSKKSNAYSALAEFGKASKATRTRKTTTKKATSSKKSLTSSIKSETNKLKIKTPEKENESLVSTAYNNIVEYYDLPYRYNQTVVKVLAQNPNTLFVYWDVSDDDIENFKKQYGDNFLYITKPVLVVHNLSDNYSFELDINDFANNWYIYVEDTKCKYSVELCRRPNQSNRIENIITKETTDFINISYSNTIEMPNDRILFFKDNEKIYFKNIKTNKITEVRYLSNKFGKKLKAIYSNYNLSENEDRFDFKNPSSQNPTSNVM